jgi:hypothetical protein
MSFRYVSDDIVMYQNKTDAQKSKDKKDHIIIMIRFLKKQHQSDMLIE